MRENLFLSSDLQIKGNVHSPFVKFKTPFFKREKEFLHFVK